MILVINSGSSSIKMAVVAMSPESGELIVAEGLAERLNEPEGSLHWRFGDEQQQRALAGCDHRAAMQHMLHDLFEHMDAGQFQAVGHRVVHGGERFVTPTLLDAETITGIESISHLAPLHNPANLAGIVAAMQQLSGVPHVAVFDTAFHHAMPRHAGLYAVPYEWYSEYGVRRYGFHGSSHHFVAQEAARLLGKDINNCHLLTAHLGNGCSAAAVKDGISVDTTMGMTPLEGLVMGTRSGDVDPGLHDYLARRAGMRLADINEALNRRSGLLGISGLSNDMRTLLAEQDAGNERARLAVDMFCYRLAKSLAGLAVALGRVDGIVFTGGIGEHAAAVRQRTVAQLGILGATLDDTRNELHGQGSDGYISPGGAPLPVLVVATSEERMIARYARQMIQTEEDVQP